MSAGAGKAGQGLLGRTCPASEERWRAPGGALAAAFLLAREPHVRLAHEACVHFQEEPAEQAGLVVPPRPLFGETPGDALRLWGSPADVPETTGPPLGVSTAVLQLAPRCCDWLTLVNTTTLPDEGQVVGQILPVRVPVPVTLPGPDPFRG